MSKKLTQAQIRAIITKLEIETKEAILPGGLTEEGMWKENGNYGMALIKATKLPKLVKEALSAGDYRNCPYWVSNMGQKELKKAGFPYPNPSMYYTHINKRREQLQVMLQDLKFDLTMVGQEDYKDAMDAFRQQVEKAFG